MAPELSSSMLTSSMRSYTEYEEAIEGGAGCAKPKRQTYGHHRHHDILNTSDRSDDSNSSANSNNFDLKRDYQNAIDCLINCEELITTLQKRLQTKDEQIATLEETIVQMSLQLANSKAFEDEFRSTKRRSSMEESLNDNSLRLSDISDRDNSGSDDDVLLNNNRRPTKTKKERRHTSDGAISTSGGGGRGSGRSSSKGGGGQRQRRAIRRQSMPINTSDVEPLPGATSKPKSSRRKSLLDYHQSAPPSRTVDDLPKPLPPPQPQTNQRRKWTRSLPMGDLWGGLGSGGTDDEGDNLDVSCWDERDKDLDISTYSLPLLDRTEGSMSTSNNSFGFGKMFNRSKSKDKLLDASERGGGGGLDVSERLDTSHKEDTTTATNQDQSNNNRRAPSKARLDRQFQGSSRSFLEGVVFPKSLEDVVVKGLELRDSLTKSNRSMRMEDGSFRDG